MGLTRTNDLGKIGRVGGEGGKGGKYQATAKRKSQAQRLPKGLIKMKTGGQNRPVL